MPSQDLQALLISKPFQLPRGMLERAEFTSNLEFPYSENRPPHAAYSGHYIVLENWQLSHSFCVRPRVRP
jgi:hypothetical protein